MNSIDRRSLIKGAAAAVCLVEGRVGLGEAPVRAVDVDVLREPDVVRIFTGDGKDEAVAVERGGGGWQGGGITVAYADGAVELRAAASGWQAEGPGVNYPVTAAGVGVRRVQMRWTGRVGEDVVVLGDAWERSYGDLHWGGLQAERAMPWYCVVHGGGETVGFGVETGAGAFAFWQVDAEGVSLWLDVRNGGNGVRLGDRKLDAATVVTVRGERGESPFAVTRGLCRKMAGKAKVVGVRGGHPVDRVFGSNDWYYAYGKNSPEGILRDAELVREVSPAGALRPFTVIDDGYQDRARFPDMAKLAEDIRRREVTPGIWVRPAQAKVGANPAWLMPQDRYGARHDAVNGLAFDPTVPEAREAMLGVVREAVGWGYELIKHDFTSYELLGQWGFAMGASPTIDGWSFHDRSLTNAEILSGLYRDIRGAAGEDRIVLGCNTVGHLAVGHFDAQRTGDDVSGREWERTRRMGVNTLAFRLPQNGVFFAGDADCVPLTHAIPWALTKRWLEAVAGSGTVLLISPEPGAVGAEQKVALREAFRRCASGGGHAEPVDWVSSRTPGRWSDGARYEWLEAWGAGPFGI